MTKDIEEAARALIARVENGTDTACIHMSGCAKYQEMKQALDPEPNKPTREECVETVDYFRDGCSTDSKYYKDLTQTIQYLQEPQKGVWIENTGDNPNLSDCKLIIQYGGCDNCADLREVHSSDLNEFDWVEWYPEDRIYQYMIIE